VLALAKDPLWTIGSWHVATGCGAAVRPASTRTDDWRQRIAFALHDLNMRLLMLHQPTFRLLGGYRGHLKVCALNTLTRTNNTRSRPLLATLHLRGRGKLMCTVRDKPGLY
jgi:hypothetical protein